MQNLTRILVVLALMATLAPTALAVAQAQDSGAFYTPSGPTLDHLRLGSGLFIRDLTKPAHACLSAPADETPKAALRTSYDESFIFSAQHMRSFLGIDIEASVPAGPVPVSGSLHSRFERLFDAASLHFVMSARSEFEPERLGQVSVVKDLSISQALCGDYVVVGVRRATYVAAILSANGVSEQTKQELNASITLGSPATANLTAKVNIELLNAYKEKRFTIRIVSSGGTALKSIMPDLSGLNLGAQPAEFVSELFTKVRSSIKTYVDGSADSRPAAAGFYLMPLNRFITVLGQSPILNELKVRRLETIAQNFARFDEIRNVYSRRAPSDLTTSCTSTTAEMCVGDIGLIDVYLSEIAVRHKECIDSTASPASDPKCAVPTGSPRIPTIASIFNPVRVQVKVVPVRSCVAGSAIEPALALSYLQQVGEVRTLAERDAALLAALKPLTDDQVTQAQIDVSVSGPNIRSLQWAAVDDASAGAAPIPLQTSQPGNFTLERTRAVSACGPPFDNTGLVRLLVDRIPAGILSGRLILRAVDSTSYQSDVEVVRFSRTSSGALQLGYVPYVLTTEREKRQ